MFGILLQTSTHMRNFVIFLSNIKKHYRKTFRNEVRIYNEIQYQSCYCTYCHKNTLNILSCKNLNKFSTK